MGTASWEPSPSTTPACGWRSQASSQPRTEGQQRGGPSLPLPHSSACRAPLGLVTPGCGALRLCIWEEERKRSFGAFPVTSSYKQTATGLSAVEPTGTYTGTHTQTHKNTHWACTQAHTLKERHPGAFLAPLIVRAQKVGIGVGLTSCVIGWATSQDSGPGVGGASMEGAPRNPGLGEGGNWIGSFWVLGKFGAIRIFGFCGGFSLFSFIFILKLKRTL